MAYYQFDQFLIPRFDTTNDHLVKPKPQNLRPPVLQALLEGIS